MLKQIEYANNTTFENLWRYAFDGMSGGAKGGKNKLPSKSWLWKLAKTIEEIFFNFENYKSIKASEPFNQKKKRKSSHIIL